MKKLLFVYGTLKKNKRLHVYLDQPGCTLLGEHVTEPAFTMYSYNGSFPIVVPTGKTPITGEVYEVDNDRALGLIWGLEGYRGSRGHAQNWYDTCSCFTPYGEAEMFIMHSPPEGLPVVESGEWK